MREKAGEKLLQVVTARRKTRGQTQFKLGVGYETDHAGTPTGRIRLRTGQMDTDVAAVVGSLTLEEARGLLAGLAKAIEVVAGSNSA